MRKKNDKKERGEENFSSFSLKKDHEKRPLWILPNNTIFLEAFSPIYARATDFLIAIADPRSRLGLIHEFEITEASLYTAVSLHYTLESILAEFNELAKNKEMPYQVYKFIKENTENYGKAKLVLYENRYFIECEDDTVFARLVTILKDHLNQKGIRDNIFRTERLERDVSMIDIKDEKIEGVWEKDTNEISEFLERCFIADELKKVPVVKWINRIEFDPKNYAEFKEVCKKKNIPLTEEYDYMGFDDSNPLLDIKIHTRTKIREYQLKALSKMFTGGRAKSGMIVLPCGAGKSLVGVKASCNIKKRTLVFCTSVFSVRQWAKQFLQWSDVKEYKIVEFTAKTKDPNLVGMLSPKCSIVLITTYRMIFRGSGQEPGDEKLNDRIRNQIKQLEWGLVILDEVHVAPAETFSNTLKQIKSHCKLGLTATPLREDEGMGELEHLIGPKLHEENWRDLENLGFLARALCIEVRCKMTSEFKNEYKKTPNRERRKLLYIGNPEKFFVLQYLLQYHEARGDKILVFSHQISVLRIYAKLLKKPKVYGQTSTEKREKIFEKFRERDDFNVIIISSVGDTSLDLPDANVVIELSAHSGSRRQFTQRFGRILRPKPGNKDRFNAFFYTVVSQETEDMYYSQKRQTYLVNQGYVFKVLNSSTLDYSYYFGRDKELILKDSTKQKSYLEELFKKADEAINFDKLR